MLSVVDAFGVVDLAVDTSHCAVSNFEILFHRVPALKRVIDHCRGRRVLVAARAYDGH